MLRQIYLFALLIAAGYMSDVSAANLSTSFGYSRSLQSLSVGTHINEANVSDRLKIGYGARATFFHSGTVTFSTASASEINRKRIEVVQADRVSILSTSAMGFAEVELDGGYFLTASIDALGFSLGPATQLSTADKKSIAKPSPLNVLVFDKYDLGSLNSFFMLARRLEKKRTVSIGLAHQFIEYTADNSFVFQNRRFRLKNDAVVVSLSWSEIY